MVNYQEFVNEGVATGNAVVLEELAKTGNTRMKLLAGMTLLSKRNARDSQEGIKLLTEVAAKGEGTSMQSLGMIYLNGYTGIPADRALGLSWLTRATMAGNQPARNTLESIYSNGGFGLPPDAQKAAALKRLRVSAPKTITQLDR